MKKKFLSLIAVSAALATAGSALVACGGNEATMELTKEQWASALSIDNFTSNFKAESSMTFSEESTESTEAYIVIVGAKKYGDFSRQSIITEGSVKQREYKQIRIEGSERDSYYIIRSGFSDENGTWEEGEWVVDDKTHMEYDNDEWQESVLYYIGFTYFNVFADKYDSFKYNNGAYVLSGDGIVIDVNAYEDDDYSSTTTATATSATLKFTNNKLTSVEMNVHTKNEVSYRDKTSGEDSVREDDVKFSVKVTYGAQKITAPSNAVKNEEEE